MSDLPAKSVNYRININLKSKKYILKNGKEVIISRPQQIRTIVDENYAERDDLYKDRDYFKRNNGNFRQEIQEMAGITRSKKSRKKRHSTGKSRSESGYIPSLKFSTRGKVWEYESSIEHDRYIKADHCPHTIDLQPQPIEIYVGDNKIPLVPDLWELVEVGDSCVQVLTQIKDFKTLLNLQDNEKWVSNKKIIQKICEERGWIYNEVDEYDIRDNRLKNIKLMQKAVKTINLIEKEISNHDNRNLDENNFAVYQYREYHRFRHIAKEVLRENGNELEFIDIMSLIHDRYKENLSLGWIVTFLLSHIYYQQEIFIDITKPLFETPITLTKVEMLPVYQIKAKKEKKRNKLKDQKILTSSYSIDKNHDQLTRQLRPLISRYTILLKNHENERNKARLNWDQEGLSKKKKDERNKKLKIAFTTNYKKMIREFAKVENRKYNEVYSDFQQWKKKEKDKEIKEILSPIINKIGPFQQRNDVYAICKDLGYDEKRSKSVYYHYNKNKNEIMNNNSSLSHKTRPSRFMEEVEKEILIKINEWNKQGGAQQSNAAAQDIHKELKKLYGNNVPSKRTILRRMDKLYNTPQTAKSHKRRAKKIHKALTSYFGEGLYPGALIQCDHTQLDIWVRSRATGAPFCRPWLTVALDLYSGAIWGFALSPFQPDGERVAQMIINGISKKDQTEEWDIAYNVLKSKLAKEKIPSFIWTSEGLIAKISFDNGLDFHSRAVKNLLLKLNITIAYRPTYRPEYAGKIEKFWDIINSNFRNSGFAGVVYPTDKNGRKTRKRAMFTPPPKYNSKLDSKNFYDEFQIILYTYLIIKYQNTKHGKEPYTPNEKWKIGIHGKPFEPKLFPFSGQSLIYNQKDVTFFTRLGLNEHSSILKKNGLRFKNFTYTGDWIINGRISGELLDGQRISYRWSKWDAGHIWIKTRRGWVELKASNYHNSKDVRRCIMDILEDENDNDGKYQMKTRMDRKSVEYLEKLVGHGVDLTILIDDLMDEVNTDYKKKGISNARNRKIEERLSHTTDTSKLLSGDDKKIQDNWGYEIVEDDEETDEDDELDIMEYMRNFE